MSNRMQSAAVAAEDMIEDYTPPEPESPRDKAKRKFLEEPLVPLGSLATVIALLAASNSMRRGDRANFNVWLRWRVVAQGATVLAALGGSIWYSEERRKKRQMEELHRARCLPKIDEIKIGMNYPRLFGIAAFLGNVDLRQ